VFGILYIALPAAGAPQQKQLPKIALISTMVSLPYNDSKRFIIIIVVIVVVLNCFYSQTILKALWTS